MFFIKLVIMTNALLLPHVINEKKELEMNIDVFECESVGYIGRKHVSFVVGDMDFSNFLMPLLHKMHHTHNSPLTPHNSYLVSVSLNVKLFTSNSSSCFLSLHVVGVCFAFLFFTSAL